MIETEVDARERTVEVSPAALGVIFPELGLAASPGRRSRLARLASSLKLRSRLMTARILYRLGDFRSLHCRVVQWRLRARLLWLKIRHRRALRRGARPATGRPPSA